MSRQTTLDDVLDAAEQLDADAQAELVAVLKRRLAERGRERVVETLAQARREFTAGQCEVMSAAEIVRKAQS
jgi:ribose 1,5-bisphosphokinase PhnN